MILGAVFTLLSHDGLSHWPAATVLALWPALGGHFVELCFLNWLRQRLPFARSAQMAGRVVVWVVGGIVLLIGMRWTAGLLQASRPARWPGWWIGGLGFVGIELVVHLALLLRGSPNFYRDRKIESAEM
jgi:hypothetical protein